MGCEHMRASCVRSNESIHAICNLAHTRNPHSIKHQHHWPAFFDQMLSSGRSRRRRIALSKVSPAIQPQRGLCQQLPSPTGARNLPQRFAFPLPHEPLALLPGRPALEGMEPRHHLVASCSNLSPLSGRGLQDQDLVSHCFSRSMPVLFNIVEHDELFRKGYNGKRMKQAG